MTTKQLRKELVEYLESIGFEKNNSSGTTTQVYTKALPLGNLKDRAQGKHNQIKISFDLRGLDEKKKIIVHAYDTSRKQYTTKMNIFIYPELYKVGELLTNNKIDFEYFED